MKLESVIAFNSLFVNSADTTLLTPRIQIKFQSKGKYRLAETRIGSYGNMLEIDEDSLTALGELMRTIVMGESNLDIRNFGD